MSADGTSSARKPDVLAATAGQAQDAVPAASHGGGDAGTAADRGKDSPATVGGKGQDAAPDRQPARALLRGDHAAAVLAGQQARPGATGDLDATGGLRSRPAGNETPGRAGGPAPGQADADSGRQTGASGRAETRQHGSAGTDELIAAKDRLLAERDATLSRKEAVIDAQWGKISEQDATIADLRAKLAKLEATSAGRPDQSRPQEQPPERTDGTGQEATQLATVLGNAAGESAQAGDQPNRHRRRIPLPSNEATGFIGTAFGMATTVGAATNQLTNLESGAIAGAIAVIGSGIAWANK